MIIRISALISTLRGISELFAQRENFSEARPRHQLRAGLLMLDFLFLTILLMSAFQKLPLPRDLNPIESCNFWYQLVCILLLAGISFLTTWLLSAIIKNLYLLGIITFLLFSLFCYSVGLLEMWGMNIHWN